MLEHADRKQSLSRKMVMKKAEEGWRIKQKKIRDEWPWEKKTPWLAPLIAVR